MVRHGFFHTGMADHDGLVTIDPDAITPLYQQLVQILRDRIKDGTYPPGKRMPSRFELEQEFGLAQGTISKALDRLKDEGLIVGITGRGTFVREAEKDQES